MNERDALLLALKGEKGAVAFYDSVAKSATDAALIALAREFVAEETEHVAILKDWLARTQDTGPVEDLDPPVSG